MTNMITLDLDTSQGIKRQIKQRIKELIRGGGLKAGQRVPSSRQLAQTLGVNRNTAWAAYRELTAEGWLTSGKGRGTRVSDRPGRVEMNELEESFRMILEQGSDLGLDWRETAQRLQGYVDQRASLANRRVLVVECNPEALEHISAQLERQLGLRPRRALIQDLARASRPPQEDLDLIVCGFNHLGQLKALFPHLAVPVLGVMLQPDLEVMSELLTRPAGDRVGMVCVNRLSTKSLFRQAIEEMEPSGSGLWAGLEQEERLAQILRTCQVVYASSYAYDQLKQMAPPHLEIKKVELTIDQGGLELVAQRLAQAT